MKYPAYDKYKPSGIEWLGNVPAHWKVARSDGMVSSERRQVQPEVFLSEDVFHYSIPLVQEYGTGAIEEGESIKSAKQPVFRKSLLVSKLNPRKATIVVAEPQPDLRTLCSTEFVTLFADKCDLGFLTYVTLSEAFRQRLDAAVQSVTRSHQRANPRDIYSFWNAWPPLDEQQTIARFLDAKTAQINALVAQKRQLIDKLKEKRQALIARTVTRGLPPEAAKAAGLETNPAMKDSGVDWLGDVPKRWQVLPLRRLIKFVKTGNTPSGVEEHHFEEKGFNWYTPGDISDALYLGSATRALSAEGKAQVRIFPEKTVMFVGIGTLGKVGLALTECSCNQQINAIVCGLKLDPVFATYYLKILRDFVMKCGKYTTLPIINQDETKNLIFAVPPLAEQSAIAAYLDRETVEIDRLTGQVDDAISRLLEYRQALITSAVTGKIDVRELA